MFSFKEKQKVTDGIHECWFGGSTNTKGFPNGEGMLAYPNKNCFKGTFKVLTQSNFGVCP